MLTLGAISPFFSLDGYGPAALLVAAAVALLVWQQIRIKLDPREPPLLRPWIPFIGHVIGMLRFNQRYFEKLSIDFPAPAFTLPVYTSKMYIIASPELQQVAFRENDLDFDPFIVEFGIRLVQGSPEMAKIFRHIPEDPKEMPFMKGFHKAMHEYMTPGPNIQSMNANMLKTIAREMNDIQDDFKSNFYVWLRNSFTLATANAIFGSNNPWAKNPSLIDSFWDFERNLLFLLAGFMPSVLAPKAFKARIANQTALREYFAAGYGEDPDVSKYAHARADVIRSVGFSQADVGRFEIANIHVSVANATPTFFWLVLFIVSDPQLTDDIRAELKNVISSSDEEGQRVMTINITNISDACPLLLSAYQETMRLTNGQTATRLVKRDLLLSDSTHSYLLTKGATVMMPGGIPHYSKTVWGPSAATFDARRFLKPNADTSKKIATSEADKLRKKAFVPFGGGIHLCPGRHFAFSEILGSVALLTMGFEITTEQGATISPPAPGEWKTVKFGEAVGKPVGRLANFGARIRRRKGLEDVIWRFETGLKG